MNPLALLFALLSTVGAAGALSGGRRRNVVAEDDDATAGLATVPSAEEPAGAGSGTTNGPATGAGTSTGTTGSTGRGTGANAGAGTSDDTAPPSGPVKLPDPPVQTGGTGTDGGSVAPTPIEGQPVTMMTGRMRTLEPQGDDIASVRILSQPEHGHVSVNPDKTIAVVLTQTKATGPMSFSYEITHGDGTTSVVSTPLDVVPGAQAKGWGTSERQYMLATDENDRVIVEHGDKHRVVYVSGSDKALSLADIAALEKVPVSTITGGWLRARPHYGSSEEMALAPDAGFRLWSTLNPSQSLATDPASETSNWLLLERGYAYDAPRLISQGVSGESELHPLYIGAWGEGEKPEITTYQRIFQKDSFNIVFQDLKFTNGFQILHSHNILFDNVTFTGDGELAVSMNSSGITLHNSAFYDINRDETIGPDPDFWSPNQNRISGIYAQVHGLLIEGSFFDQNGWDDGYRVDGSTLGAQPPSKFNHNMYIQYGSSDVTVRDTISMRAASYGAQFRSGGFIEDNVFIDNNAGFAFLGGNFGGKGPIDNYSLVTDNVTTNAGFRNAPDIGAQNWGMDDGARLSSIVDNIVAHMVDPNNPSVAGRTTTRSGNQTASSEFYNDTIVWNWGPAKNSEGLDPAVLKSTTIQNFTAELLGKPNATITDLANYLRAQAEGAFDNVVDADLIVRFFQAGFGIAPDIRTETGMLRFIPDELGEGVRWDNRLNWSTDDLPSEIGRDSVDLGGNKVVFGGTVTVDQLEFGPNGGLRFEHGKLTVAGGMETGKLGATLDVNGAGQIWTEGGRGEGVLDIDVTGGRFANTGNFRMNSELTASGGQTLLGVDGATYAVTNGSRLEIEGAGGEVGFDGAENGISILGLGSGGTLAFSAKGGALGSIEEFRSGALGDAPKVLSGVDLGKGRLELDLTELVASNGTFTLVDVDELIGSFASTNITGLGSRNAEIFIDYETDTISLSLAAGTGAVKTSVKGLEAQFDAGEADLWKALTAGRGTYDDEIKAVDDEDFLFAA